MTKRKDPPKNDDSDMSDSDTEMNHNMKNLLTTIFQFHDSSLNNVIVRPKRNVKKKEETQKSYELLRKYIELTTNLHSGKDIQYFNKTLTLKHKRIIVDKLEAIHSMDYSSKPKIIQLIESDIPLHFKSIGLKKIIQLQNGIDNSGKLEQWIDSFLKIPFKNSCQLPVTMEDGPIQCKEFIDYCEKTLNECTYGMHHAKNQLLQIIGKWLVNPSSMGTAIALKGPMGTGKTTLIKHGISKILNRPFAFITLGGNSDGCYLTGHSYTYEGSTYGKIVDILIQSKCNNPVIFFDELDKVSQTEKGEEIVGVLTHLTDTTQNSQFHDKYFSEIDFDLSKCLFIFSYNEEHKVNPILKDRMYTIDIHGYNKKEKTMIALDYLLPEIKNEYDGKLSNLEFSEEIIDYIIEKIEKEEGVRNLKRALETICNKINLRRFYEPNLFDNSYLLSTKDIDTMLIKKNKEKSYTNMYL